MIMIFFQKTLSINILCTFSSKDTKLQTYGTDANVKRIVNGIILPIKLFTD